MNYNYQKIYLEDYNKLIFLSSKEIINQKSVKFSPTFSRQETLTFLYDKINNKESLNFIEKIILIISFFIRLFLTFISITLIYLITKKYHVKKNSYYFRTWLVRKSFIDKKVKDIYFGKIYDDFSKNKNITVGFHSLNIINILKFLRFNSKSNYIIPISILNYGQVLSSFKNFLNHGYLKVKNIYMFNGSDISNYINDSLFLDFVKFRSFSCYLDYEIANTLNKRSIKKFIYVFENQSWENAYLMSLDKRITIGYQSSGFSLRFLNFFPCKDEVNTKIYPSKILTVGKLFSKALADYGYYKCPIVDFAALRFDYPTIADKYMISKQDLIIKKRVLFAFSVIKEEYLKILLDLIVVFKDSSVHLDLKFHPVHNPKKILKEYKIKLPSNINVINSVEMNKLSQNYDITLFNDNSFGIESLIKGVKSFEYNVSKLFDETRLIYFKLYDFQLNKIQLNTIINQIDNLKYDKILNTKLLFNYINNLYLPYKIKSLKLITDEK